MVKESKQLHTFEEVIPAVSGAEIVIIAQDNHSEMTEGQLAIVACERQRANLYRRYGTHNPGSIRDYWLPKG